MDEPKAVPPLVRPSDCASDQKALIVIGRPDERGRHPSPFSAVTWRLIPDASQRTCASRRPYAGA